MDMKKIKKALLQSNIRLTTHVMQRIEQRGYTRSDLIACIMSGEITSIQPHRNKVCAVIEGLDTDGLPMVIVVGYDLTRKALFAIVTAMPPIDEKFKRVI